MTTKRAAAPDEPRQRLLLAALQLFAQQGFAKTSTRELAEAAAVNVAAISYYFGDKAGLYRAAFVEPMGSVEADLARFAPPQLSLADALRGYYECFLAPLRAGAAVELCMKLHFREMLEPTDLGQAALVQSIEPLHTELLRVLMRHLGLAEADIELQRLAVALAGLGVNVHVSRDISDRLAPALNQDAGAIDAWADALVRYALALVRAEALRRGVELAGEGA